MGRYPGFARRRVPLALEKDVVKVGLCLLLLVLLAVAGLPVWMALPLPLLAYAGLWLLVPSARRTTVRPLAGPRTPAEAYAACLDLREKIRGQGGRVEDARLAERLHRITAVVDKSLAAIAEDGKEQAALALFDLTATTDRLLTGYLKVARRGFAGAEVRERTEEDLATLEAAYARYWERLNRDAVVNLAALSATIDFTLNESTALRQLGGTA